MIGVEAAAVSSVASGVLKIVGNKLAPLVIERYSSVVGVTKDVEELRILVEEINSWLERAQGQAMWDDASLNWLKQLKDVAYAVDDVIDEFQLKAEKHDAGGENGSGTVSKYMCTKLKSLIFQCNMANKIKSIKRSFAAIVKQRTDFSAIANSLPQVGHPVIDMNETAANMPFLPNVDVASVLGRDQEKHQIISKLIETNEQQRIKIVSIIGLGGSGKTTLAKLVFNDGNIIEKHYEVRLWVHVSQEFDIKKLIKRLFEAIADKDPGQHALPYMSNKISDKLTGKRFLVVLDDVWTECRIQWENLMVYLHSGAHGSGILLTTRSREVAETVESTDQLDMPFLSPSDSWQLFQQSLVMPREGLEFEFEQVGKEIVKICGGVPLAIKVLAGALRGKERIEEWHAMRDSNLLDIGGEEHGVSVSACLRLSYFHLSTHLKQCFTICSVFPKGHKFDKDQLIDLWIAHDMIKPEAGVNYLDYIGHRYFTSLVQMSFLQDVEEEDGRVTCRMHDLVHDLARSILGDEISLVIPEETSSKKCYRYFSLIGQPENLSSTERYRYYPFIEQPEEIVSRAKNLAHENLLQKVRSIYINKGDDVVFGKAMKNARHLRSVTVESIFKTTVLTHILQVRNLKYLHISRLYCAELPEVISDIWSLQVLHITSNYLVKLPKYIGKLQKLRMLNLWRCTQLKCLPDSIGDCQMISSIDLCNCSEFTLLPNSIGRNKKLRVLRLGKTKIERLPSTVTTLRNLEYLDLHNCSEVVELPEGIGNLDNLQVLNISACEKLGPMPIGIGHLSRLQKLSLFVVGQDEKSAPLSELEKVGRNSDHLTIRGIARVMDPDDAHMACLKEKKNLHFLKLDWGRYDEGHVNVNPEIEEAVLDGLQPPSGLKELKIDGYSGRRYARWMLNQVGGGVQGLPYFPFLRVMKLYNFPNLKHLHGLVEMTGLEELELQEMPSLQSITGGPFPSLVKLVLNKLASLGEVWMVAERTVPTGEEGEGCSNCSTHLGQVRVGTCISHLDIHDCPNLKVKPYLPLSLQRLWLLRRSEQLLESPDQCQGSSSSSPFSFSHLKKLELWGMTGLGPGRGWKLLQHMTAVESLEICHSGALAELPESLRSLASIESLLLCSCSAIRMLPEWLGELRSLQKLTIESCDRLSTLPESMGRLASLRVLKIGWCDELQELPECLGELCSLSKLDISKLPRLTCLPESLCDLTSLEELKIWSCKGIRSLPQGIKGLASLQRLWISDCRDLERRCRREYGGEDWHLISHIPHLDIW